VNDYLDPVDVIAEVLEYSASPDLDDVAREVIQALELNGFSLTPTK